LDAIGGRTDLVKNTLIGDAISAGFLDGFTGGDDTLISGEYANDIMTGDWGNGGSLLATGGADTFVFGPNNGNDRIADFRSADGDTINLVATGLVWTDFNGLTGDLVLDNSDAFVSIVDGNTVLDLGAAVGDETVGVNIVTVTGVTGLVEGDFDFMLVV
jgi:hypothetical protein